MSEKNIPRPNEKATYLTFWVGRDKEKVRLKVRDKGLIIGRSSSSRSVDLDTKPYDGDKLGVSRQHVFIGAKKDYFYVQDLESVNSTWLNRVRLKPMIATELYHGDILYLGECRIEVHYTYEDEVEATLEDTKLFGESASSSEKGADEKQKSTRVFGKPDPSDSNDGKTGSLSSPQNDSKDEADES